jgi:hypothetical protein
LDGNDNGFNGVVRGLSKGGDALPSAPLPLLPIVGRRERPADDEPLSLTLVLDDIADGID